ERVYVRQVEWFEPDDRALERHRPHHQGWRREVVDRHPSEVFDAPGREARAVPGRRNPGRLEHPDDPTALPAIGLQELEHALVRPAGFTSARPGNQVRDVEVANADGIRIAQSADADLCRRPWADARQRPQASIGV